MIKFTSRENILVDLYGLIYRNYLFCSSDSLPRSRKINFNLIIYFKKNRKTPYMIKMGMGNKDFFNLILESKMSPFPPVSNNIFGQFSASTKQENPQSDCKPGLKTVLS
jgi:hypothetical protein